LRPVTLAAAAMALGFVASPARAQGTDEFGPYGGQEKKDRIRSPQNMAVELRFGPYVPRIDSEFGSATPYRSSFGKKKRIMIGFEVDYQVLRIPYFGSVGPGFGWGFTSMGGKATVHTTGASSDQPIGLSIMPMYLVGVLRFDYLALETGIPLAFYAKAGLGYALWWTTSGGKLARVDGAVGEGVSYGYHGAIGASFLLNALDRSAAVEMDNTTGINSAYLFGEFFMSNLNGFGSGTLQVGANTWVVGLAFEF
jgi:hypothetical protein